jgi:hypothetical protein
MLRAIKKRSIGVVIRYFIVLNVLIFIGAYPAQQAGAFTGKKRNDDYILLGLVGYNYTDRHISVYSVGGVDGGHINLSSPTSGGSGVSCCLRLSKKNSGPIRVKVRWQVDGCLYLIRNPVTGAADNVRHYYFKESEIDVQRVLDESPNYLETHFYPNGSVRVRLVENISDPLFELPENRTEKSYFPGCKDDKNPEE